MSCRGSAWRLELERWRCGWTFVAYSSYPQKDRKESHHYLSKVLLFDPFGGDYMDTVDTSKSTGWNLMFAKAFLPVLGVFYRVDPILRQTHGAGIVLITCECRRGWFFYMWSLVTLRLKICGRILCGFEYGGYLKMVISVGEHDAPWTFGVCYFGTPIWLCFNLNVCVYVSFENPLYGRWEWQWSAQEPQGVAAAQLISEQAQLDSLGPRYDLVNGRKHIPTFWTPHLAVQRQNSFLYKCFKYGQVLNPIIKLQFGWFVSGWWFGTWLLFLYIENFIIPIDFHSFQRGWCITNQVLFIATISGVPYVPLGRGIFIAEVLSLPSLPGRGKLLMALATAAKEVRRQRLVDGGCQALKKEPSKRAFQFLVGRISYGILG